MPTPPRRRKNPRNEIAREPKPAPDLSNVNKLAFNVPHEAKDALGISKKILLGLLKDGKLVAKRLAPRRRVIQRSELLRFLDELPDARTGA